MYRRFVFIAGGLAAVVGLLLAAAKEMSAQDAVLTELYGHGVHAYFAHDYQQAYDDFTNAIEGGSEDPRVYYFRALSQMRMGRDADAADDLQQGASLEVNDSGGAYPVARSLERIQGRQRLLIEQHRSQARVVAMQREEKRRVQRYAPRDDGSVPIVEQPAPARGAGGVAPPADGAEGPFTVESVEPGAAASGDPFNDPAAVVPETETVAPGGDPFEPAPAADMPAEEAAPAEEAMPAEEAAPAEEAPADAADPFADEAAEGAAPAEGAPAEDMPAEEADPFGAPAEGAAPAEEATPAEGAPVEDADPFGGAAMPEGPDLTGGGGAADATIVPGTDPAPAAGTAVPGRPGPAAAEAEEAMPAEGEEAAADPLAEPATEDAADDPFAE